MLRSRREFLTQSTLAMLGAAAKPMRTPQGPGASEPTPGAPPAFGTLAPAGPEVSPATFTEAEKLVQVELTSAERDLAASSWRANMASGYGRRTAPRKVEPERQKAPGPAS